MIKLSNQEFVEALQSGMIVAGLVDGVWHQFPVELLLGGEPIQITVDHYLDPAEIYQIFLDNISNASFIQIINNLQNG